MTMFTLTNLLTGITSRHDYTYIFYIQLAKGGNHCADFAH